jgi:hypothetical protein
MSAFPLKKRPDHVYEGVLGNKNRQRLTLPGFTLVPSARVDLTSLFGMGRGDPHRYSHLKICLDIYVRGLMCNSHVFGLLTIDCGLKYR